MIRELAECGGVAGLNLEPTFLNEDETDKVSRIERICDHAMHLIDRGGIECVGLGTDFDGISGKFEISDCTKLPLLFDALRKRGLSEDAVELIAYKNTARVMYLEDIACCSGKSPCGEGKYRLYFLVASL